MCLFISKCHLPARAPHCCWVCRGWCGAGLGLREFSSNELQMGSPNRPRVQARGCEGDLLCVVVCHELTLITPGRGVRALPQSPPVLPGCFPLRERRQWVGSWVPDKRAALNSLQARLGSLNHFTSSTSIFQLLFVDWWCKSIFHLRTILPFCVVWGKPCNLSVTLFTRAVSRAFTSSGVERFNYSQTDGCCISAKCCND